MIARVSITVLLAISVFHVAAQSKTTENLQKDNSDALSLFFYNNTLRMLNQNDDPGFDELIKDIEKMKLLVINKKPGLDFRKVVKDYQGESFEEAMSSRHEGKNMNVYIKDTKGKTAAMLVLINDEKSLYVLDIVGSIALTNVAKLYKTLDESSDIRKKIVGFTGQDDDGEEKKN